jgi:uncharacterized protein (UPF0332 family)
MDKIVWCGMQGMVLDKPDKNLAQIYLYKASQSLKSMNEVTSIEWKINAGYYTIYFSLYAVLRRIGIISEIHDCTIAVMEKILYDYYDKDDVMIVNIAKKLRIDSLYYANREAPEALIQSILSKVEYFLEKNRNIVSTLNPSQISSLRATLRKILDPQ